MGTDDESVYRKNVRNVSILVVVAAIILVAGLVLPAYFAPASPLPVSNSAFDPNGLMLSISINGTQAFGGSELRVSVWINGSSSIVNATAEDLWAVNQSRLLEGPCGEGWPIGIGVMQGYYDEYNYTSGTLLPPSQPDTTCPASFADSAYFLVQPLGSEAIAGIDRSLVHCNLLTTLVLGNSSLASRPQVGGTYTVIGADEWGDIAILYVVAPGSAR